MPSFFLAPIFLLGALLAVVPVVIHLLYQRRAPEVHFSTLRFLQACVRKTARRKRVENLLLLVFRMLLFGLLAVALAKPFVRSSLAGSSGPVSTVIVLDNSYSMATRQQGVERFAVAKAAAADAVRRMSERDSVALILTSGPRAADKVELTHRLNDVHSAIAQAEVFAGTADVAGAMGRAFECLRASTDVNREVVVLTDLQALSFEGDLASGAPAARDWPVFLLDCGQEAVVDVAVTGASLKSGPAAGNLRTLVAELRNPGDGDVRDARVTLYVDGKDAKGELVDVPGRGKASVAFTFPSAPDRTVSGWVQLGNDSLAADNRWNFRIGAADLIHALVVRDEAAAIAYLDEGYYLVRALAPSGSDNEIAGPIRPQLAATRDLATAGLDDFAAVFLLNVRELDAASVARLRRWVESGGLVVFFPGDRVEPSRWSAFFDSAGEGLFPAHLRAAAGDAEKRESARHMQTPDFGWAGFARLRGVPPALFERVRAWRYQPVGGFDPAKVQVLAELVGEGVPSAPMIVSSRLGRGEVVCFAVPATTGWANFPATKVFVPMLHEMVYSATGKSGRLESTLAGQPKRFDFADVPGEVTLSVETRPGTVEVRRSTRDASGNSAVFEDTWRPGIYPYSLSGATQAKDVFVVNADPRESDLRRLSEDELGRKFGALRIVVARTADDLAAERLALREGRPLTGYVFLLIVILLAFELYLANRTRPAATGAAHPGAET